MKFGSTDHATIEWEATQHGHAPDGLARHAACEERQPARRPARG